MRDDDLWRFTINTKVTKFRDKYYVNHHIISSKIDISTQFPHNST
jgi:hypothetical protein